ncbi:MAG: hypothetical protein Q7R33_01645 [Nitrosarchaeum sp.]|nr:hypothetical protein [Nitrosarchaeum sp.]
MINDFSCDGPENVISSLCLVLCNLDLMKTVEEISIVSTERHVYNRLNQMPNTKVIRIITAKDSAEFTNKITWIIAYLKNHNIRETIQESRKLDTL